jgi:hypothetical protein
MTDNEQILALEEIKKLKARYFRSLDTKDWAAYLGVFTQDAIIDSTEAYTPKDLNGAPIVFDGTVPPAPNPDWHSNGDPATFAKDLAKTLEGVQTTHHGHMPEIEFTSDTTAEGIWAMEDMLRWPAGGPVVSMHGYGHYHETYEKVDGRWRIASTRLTRLRVDVEMPK